MEKACALGEELHQADVVRHALTAIGSALLGGGGRDGRGLIERTLLIALDADLHEEADFAYSALHAAAGSRHRWVRRLACREPFVAEIAGDWQGAALAWERLGRPYEAALALQDSAEERLLRQAVNDFTGLGAPAPARITRQKMRQLGIRSIPAGPRTATRAHPLGPDPA